MFISIETRIWGNLLVGTFNVVMWLANAVASTIILIRDYKRKKNSREEAK